MKKARTQTGVEIKERVSGRKIKIEEGETVEGTLIGFFTIELEDINNKGKMKKNIGLVLSCQDGEKEIILFHKALRRPILSALNKKALKIDDNLRIKNSGKVESKDGFSYFLYEISINNVAYEDNIERLDIDEILAIGDELD